MTTNSSNGASWMKYSTQGPKQLKNSESNENSTLFNVYVNTRIAAGKKKNYDNFYINGVFNNINVANASYHASGTNKNAIFAICRGFDETDKCFEASRIAFDMLDKEQESIINEKSLGGIKNRLKTFVSSCNAKILSEHLGALNMIIVVFAFSSAIYVSCGDCALLQYSLSGKGRILSSKNVPLGINSSLDVKVKSIPYLLKNSIGMFSSVEDATLFLKSGAASKDKGETVRDYISRFMAFLAQNKPNSTATGIAVEADERPAITKITKGIMVGSAAVVLISIIHAIIQFNINAVNF